MEPFDFPEREREIGNLYDEEAFAALLNRKDPSINHKKHKLADRDALS